MPEANIIRNKSYFSQSTVFTGIEYGNLCPTDIDGFMEFRDKLYIIIEAKHKYGKMPLGQRMALERLTDTIQSTGKTSFLLLASHETKADEDIQLADAIVREYRYQNKWITPGQILTVKECVDKIVGKFMPQMLPK